MILGEPGSRLTISRNADVGSMGKAVTESATATDWLVRCCVSTVCDAGSSPGHRTVTASHPTQSAVAGLPCWAVRNRRNRRNRRRALDRPEPALLALLQGRHLRQQTFPHR